MNACGLWGIDTNNSCENYGIEGYIWVGFCTVTDLEKFLNILFKGINANDDNYIRACFSKCYRKNAWIYDFSIEDKYDNYVDCKGIVDSINSSVSLIFPQSDYTWILDKIEQHLAFNEKQIREYEINTHNKIDCSTEKQIQDFEINAYTRINHLTEVLNRLQAKESPDIPIEVFESIFSKLKKMNINKNDLDIFELRQILKKLNYHKYYEYVPYILQKINNKEPLILSENDEIKIKKMFENM